jgi:hypothetical protein
MLMRLSRLRLPEIIPMVSQSSIDAMQAHSQELLFAMFLIFIYGPLF